MRRRVDHLQQARVDVIAVGQNLVEVHRADDGTDVGHRKIADRAHEVVHLIGGRHGIHDLREHDRVARDLRVVLGDHFLRRNIEHVLHHVQLVADAVDKRHDEGKARRQRARVPPELLHGELIALRHHLHGAEDQDDAEHHQKNRNPQARIVRDIEIHPNRPP